MNRKLLGATAPRVRRDPVRLLLVSTVPLSGLLLLPAPPVLKVPVTFLLLVVAVLVVQPVSARLAGSGRRGWAAGPAAAGAVVVGSLLAIAPALYGGVALLSAPLTVGILDAVALAGLLGRSAGDSRGPGPGPGPGLGVVLGTAAMCLVVLVVPQVADQAVGLEVPSAPSSSLAFADGAALGRDPLPGFTTVRVRYRFADPVVATEVPQATYRGVPVAAVSNEVRGGSRWLAYRVWVSARCVLPFTVRAAAARASGTDPARSALRVTEWLGTGQSVCTGARGPGRSAIRARVPRPAPSGGIAGSRSPVPVGPVAGSPAGGRLTPTPSPTTTLAPASTPPPRPAPTPLQGAAPTLADTARQ